MLPQARVVADEVEALADPVRAESSAWFFKTGPGEYGEGDRFLGVRVPQVRSVCRRHRGLSVEAIDDLLQSPWHEIRLAALILMGEEYQRGAAPRRAALYELYLARTAQINNWDLVDVSAPRIVGPHLDVVGTAVLDQLAASPALWERRIAMLATLHRTMRGDPEAALHVAELLRGDAEPLIHKAVGWMLREVGKRVDESLLTQFLDDHASGMPAVMLSYATERLTPTQRTHYRERRRGG